MRICKYSSLIFLFLCLFCLSLPAAAQDSCSSDRDGDGAMDCWDGCPDDPNKDHEGPCGCGVSDVNSDGDDAPDCMDTCPNDSNKYNPGLCGCGVPDGDRDGDGVWDCIDLCPDTYGIGSCGCGTGDDPCNDLCPNDPNKTEPGVCGCGVPDVDADGDGTMDCNDLCPNDPAKTNPGVCGCGASDQDSDKDGTPDCNDGCPDDPNKTTGGVCGCGSSETACLDCAGVPFGTSKVDACGVCGGDGSTCACTEVSISSETNSVERRAKVIHKRTRKFASSAKKCAGKSYGKVVRSSSRELNALMTALNTRFTQTMLVCPANVCVQVSQQDTITELQRITKRLHRYSRSAKVSAIKACRTPNSDRDDKRKTTIDYRNDLLKAIEGLPITTYSCN